MYDKKSSGYNFFMDSAQVLRGDSQIRSYLAVI
jgi:hypothetical protein